jgi:hypothetical protein
MQDKTNSKKIFMIGSFSAAILSGLVLVFIWLSILKIIAPERKALAAPQADQYIVLAWNDLGMHCYNRNFADLVVLPPFNTLWAQVILVGDPPR